MLRVITPLSDEVEKLIHDTIGCCITVHRAHGPGLLETIYSRAIALELGAAGILFEREKSYAVTYRGESLHEQRLDFVVGGAIVVDVGLYSVFANVFSLCHSASSSSSVISFIFRPEAVTVCSSLSKRFVNLSSALRSAVSGSMPSLLDS
jgi:GxxExxY protein